MASEHGFKHGNKHGIFFRKPIVILVHEHFSFLSTYFSNAIGTYYGMHTDMYVH